MKKIGFLILMVLVLLGCDDDNDEVCTTPATIRNLEGLDGCGWVFELEDGTRLEPMMRQFFCGTPPLPKEVTEDPLYQYQFVDGKSVLINYEIMTDVASVCMVGPVVKITCISEPQVVISAE